ncbi:MAG: hypothetical protein U0U69_15215 [Acidimicrobiia bacterium]
MGVWFRTLLEVLVVVAVGGMVVSALRMVRRGQIRPERCPECGKPTSKAYPACRWCGAPLP